MRNRSSARRAVGVKRDDETEPMTRMLGTIDHTRHRDEPQRRLSDPDKTQLEIARAPLASAEPETKIVDPSTLRLALSIAAPRPERRAMPFVLAVLLAVICLATGVSLLRPRARGPKLATERPAAGRSGTSGAAPTVPVVTAITPEPAARPVDAAPEPNEPIDGGVSRRPPSRKRTSANDD
jgi:hypothetical protein